jgi:O-antigen ligase
LWIVWRIRRGLSTLPWKDPVLVAGSLLVLLGAVQIIPLPRAVLQAISPKAVELRDRYEPSEDVMAAAGAEAPSIGTTWRPISLYPWGTRQATLKFIGYLLAALITLDLAAFGFARRALVATLVGSGAFQALYGLAEYFSDRQHIFGYAKKYYTDVATGTFINRNHFAGYLEMTLPLAIALAVAAVSTLKSTGTISIGERIARASGRRLFNATGLLLLALTMATALLCSRSRMGIASMLLSFLSVGLFVFWRRRERRYAIAALIVVGATLLVFSQGDSASAITGRFLHVMDDLSGDLGRWQMWSQVGRMGAAFPVLGVGMGAFSSVFPAFRETGAGSFVTHAHGDYIELFAETGSIGCGLLLLCVGLVARSIVARRAIRPDFGTVGYAAVTGVAALGFHSLADFNMAVPGNALTLAVLLALALSWTRMPAPYLAASSTQAENRGWMRRSWLPTTVLAVIGLVAVAPVAAGVNGRAHRELDTRSSDGTDLANLIDSDNAGRLFSVASELAGSTVADLQALLQVDSGETGPSNDAITYIERRFEDAIVLQMRGLQALPTSSKGHLQMGRFLLGRCATSELRGEDPARCIQDAIVEIRTSVGLAPMSATRHAQAAHLLIPIWQVLSSTERVDLQPIIERALVLNRKDENLHNDWLSLTDLR